MQPNYYAIIPANVRYDKQLNANAKLLYGEITALCNKEGYCWASNDYFAGLYSLSLRSISRLISQLNKREYINVVIDASDANSRKITLKLPTTKMSIPTTKMSIPHDKNVLPSIYSINNTINIPGTAVNFLIENYPTRFTEDFLMPYEKKFINGDQFNEFLNDFNDEVIAADKAFGASLFGMLTKYARNWLKFRREKHLKVIKNNEADNQQANKYLDAAI